MRQKGIARRRSKKRRYGYQSDGSLKSRGNEALVIAAIVVPFVAMGWFFTRRKK